jgi:predicted nicotinamide N-methyase
MYTAFFLERCPTLIEAELTRLIADQLPGARIESATLPLCPGIKLYLLNADYPQHALPPELALRLMDEPLYWTFCWASGQVLARWLLAHPQLVRGKRVLDFGCGSGVAGIAAAMAGAREVLACDIDPLALQASEANARLNGVRLAPVADYHAVGGELDVILAADVLYDRSNLPWLIEFQRRSALVLMADSRMRGFDLPHYVLVGEQEASTIPDLDESAEFRQVRIYQTGVVAG